MLNFIWGWPSSKRPHFFPTSPGFLACDSVPRLSPSPGNLSVSNQARNQKVWALPVQSTLMLTARCITGIVLDSLGEGLCYAVTRIRLNPLLSLWGSALQYNPSRTFPSSVIVKITIWQYLRQVTFIEHLLCARNHAKCFMGTTSLYPHNHPIKYLLTRWGLQRSNNFMAIKLIGSEVGLCTQISLPQSLRSSHCDRPNNENLIFTKDFMRWHGEDLYHTPHGINSIKVSFIELCFPKFLPN